MRYAVPVTVVIEAADAQAAQLAARKMQELLDQSVVRMTLSANGVDVKQITVAGGK